MPHSATPTSVPALTIRLNKRPGYTSVLDFDRIWGKKQRNGMQSSQHEGGEVSKKGLLTGFPVRHLRHLRWLVKNYISPLPSQWADPASSSILHSRIVPTATYSPWLSDKQFLAVYEDVKEHTLVDVYRCYELWMLAKSVAQIPGSILEVGVWRGGMGAVLAAASPCKAVYLADTFHGVVKASTKDTRYRGGEHADTSQAQVEWLLRSLHVTNFILLEGIFPEDTAHQVAGPIALLHQHMHPSPNQPSLRMSVRRAVLFPSQAKSFDSKSSSLPTFRRTKTPFAASLGSSATTTAITSSSSNFSIPRRDSGRLILLATPLLFVAT